MPNPYQPLSSLTPKFSPGGMFNNAGANVAGATMGVQAKAPTQNLAQSANTIQPQWQKDLAMVQSKLKPQINVPVTPKTGIMQSLVNSQPQPPAPVPTTALKKDVAGNEYHAPATPAVAPTPAPDTSNQPKPVDTSYGGIMGGLVSKASQPTADYVAQQAEANRINQQMEEAKAQMAKQTSDINQSGTWTSRALGEQGQANIQNAGTLAALGSQYQGAVGQMGAANTQQGLQQQGLTNALGAAHPTTGVAYGTQTYNPVTGKMESAGTPFTGGQASGEAALGQQYAQNASAFKQSAVVKNNVMSFLNTTPINPSDFTKINDVVALISGQTSDPKYAQLSAKLNEYLQTIAPILGVGGGDTNFKTELAQGMLNGHMTPQAIADQLNSIETLASQKLATQAGGSGTFNTGTAQNTSQFQEGQANSTGDLVFKGGKWQPK